MPQNDIIPFNIEIKECLPDGSFLVEYIPTDGHCSPILHNIAIPLDMTPPPTLEEIMQMLADRSPQDYWRSLLTIKFADLSSRRAMVGAVQENAEALVNSPSNGITSLPRSALSSYETQVLTTSLIVQQILAEMVGNTI